MSHVSPPRSVQLLLFAATFASFAYFHPGGGWNQNARFAQVRAIVESGSLSIDSFLVYQIDRSTPVETHLKRLPVDHGEVRIDGRPYALAWVVDERGQLSAADASSEAPMRPLHLVAVSGDVAYAGGHFYPNKSPGVTLLAVPGYWLLHRLETWSGADPDDWWTLTVNAWLTSVLSVGLVSAIGCVIFFRVATKLRPGSLEAALLATLAFAWGTIYFPYATMLFEHDLMAVAFLGAFSALLDAGDGKREAWSHSLRAGLYAGGSVLANYIGAVPVLMLAVYALRRLGVRQVAWLAVGVIPSLLVIGLYDLACFGSPLATSYAPTHPGFQNTGLLLGVLGAPRLDVLSAILFSPYRGLFYGSPFLAFGIAGLLRLYRDRRWRAEAVVFVAIFAFFLAFTAAFNGWQGGAATGPRYLLPAVPFVALPAVYGFARWRRTTCLFAAWSVVVMLLATAVDPLSPLGNRDIALYPGRPLVRYDPFLDYHVRLFLEEAPVELTNAGIEAALAGYDRRMQAAGKSRAEIDQAVAQLRSELRALGPRVPPQIVPIAAFHGPVSARPCGFFEAAINQLSPPRSAVASWNSFNVGEFLAPESRLSLLPLLIVVCVLTTTALWRCRLEERRSRGKSMARDEAVVDT